MLVEDGDAKDLDFGLSSRGQSSECSSTIGRLRNRHTRRRVLGRLQKDNSVVVGEPVRVFESWFLVVAKSEISIGDYVIAMGRLAVRKRVLGSV